MADMMKILVQCHFKVIRSLSNVIIMFQMCCISASYLVTKCHKVFDTKIFIFTTEDISFTAQVASYA